MKCFTAWFENHRYAIALSLVFNKLAASVADRPQSTENLASGSPKLEEEGE
jgi:hypothetical protein